MTHAFLDVIGYQGSSQRAKIEGATLAKAVESNWDMIVNGRLGNAAGYILESVSIVPDDSATTLESWQDNSGNRWGMDHAGVNYRVWHILVDAWGQHLANGRPGEHRPVRIELLVPLDYQASTEQVPVLAA